MEKRNRNILLILLGAILLIACCCALLIGGTVLYLLPGRSSGQATQSESAKPIVLVTPEAVDTPFDETGPTFEPPTTSPTGVPQESTPRPGVATPQGNGPSINDSNAQVLQAKAEMPARDIRDLALRLKPGLDDIPLIVNPTPPVYKVGDKAKFWTENSDTQKHRQITATLVYMTDHAYMWVEQGVNLNLNDLKHSADRFETKTYPTDREFFGSEWTPGVDNDVHLSILHARDLGENIAGYYSSADEFSHLINPYSNEREMFYISADPGKVEPNSSFYDGVLAHEFQHMIHWANDRNEDSWVNEGMSELAGHLNGFDTGGAEIAYAEKPDTQLTTWNDPSVGNAEHYGASYLFMDYFLDRFGADIMKAVVASKENGIAGFDTVLEKAGRTERFDDIFADWLVANYLNQPDAAPKGHYGYKDVNPPSPVVQVIHKQFPVTAKEDVSQYAVDYIELEGSGNLSVDFTGQVTTSLVNAPQHGSYSWWANRGDDCDTTLTRAFDLRNVQAATLSFSTWYDIEDGWDYAYVEASIDGGKHWQPLSGKNTTREEPRRQCFRPGMDRHQWWGQDSPVDR